MTKFYQVYCAIAPSGGFSLVSETKFASREEAEMEIAKHQAAVTESYTHYIDGKEYKYPGFWVWELDQGPDGITRIVCS